MDGSLRKIALLRASKKTAACAPAAAATPPVPPPRRPRVLVSLDVEANGPSPACHSILSVGLAIADEQKWSIGAPIESWLLSSHEINIKATKAPHADFLEWVAQWHGLQDHFLTNCLSPREAALELMKIVRTLSASYELYWICSPSSADWMWLNYFLHEHLTPDELKTMSIGFFAECIHTRFHTLTLLGISETYVRACCFREDMPHTHRARDDAIEQAHRYLAQSSIFAQIRFMMGRHWNFIMPAVMDAHHRCIFPIKPVHAITLDPHGASP